MAGLRDDRRGHGGPDAAGVPRWDFSVNTNAAGPCAPARRWLRAADAARYPDPAYAAVGERLARWHGVTAARIVVGAGGSELVFRLTAWAAARGVGAVHAPRPGWGDYRAAAFAHGLALVDEPAAAGLLWACEPNNPDGGAADARVLAQARRPDACVVLDRAYEPLRLAGQPSAVPAGVWQLWTPNKALALPGVRAAYLLAPAGAEAAAEALRRLAPSWVLGSDGVALLQAWTDPAVHQWLAASRQRLARWARAQRSALQRLGWRRVGDGQANFDLWRPPQPPDEPALRACGIKLRDATSLGAAGLWRLSVQPPRGQRLLLSALRAAAGPQAGAGR